MPRSPISLATSARSKLETLVWFALRPPMYREAARRILSRNFTTAERGRADERAKAEARAWCESIATEPGVLFERIGADASNLGPVARAEAQAWSHAVEEAKRIPGMGGPGHVDLLYQICRALPARSVIETGVAAGWSTLAILLALERNGESGQLVSLDMPYPKRGNAHLVGAVVPPSLRGRWTLVRRPDRDALPSALQRLGSIDLAHYDSDKTYEGRLFAYPLFLARLRKGGVLMSDDIEDNLAFRDFSERVGLRPFVFHKGGGNYAGALVK
jgi:predicted O-methyltransferase YrrM